MMNDLVIVWRLNVLSLIIDDRWHTDQVRSGWGWLLLITWTRQLGFFVVVRWLKSILMLIVTVSSKRLNCLNIYFLSFSFFCHYNRAKRAHWKGGRLYSLAIEAVEYNLPFDDDVDDTCSLDTLSNATLSVVLPLQCKAAFDRHSIASKLVL